MEALKACLGRPRSAGPDGPPGLDAALQQVLASGAPGTREQAFHALYNAARISGLPRDGATRRAAANSFADAFALSGPALNGLLQAMKAAKVAERRSVGSHIRCC